MASSWEKGQFLHRTDTAILPALAFLFSSHTSHCPLASSFANIQEDASLKLIPISCLPSHVPFTSKLSEQAVGLHYLELLQLFWISCSWLSFLCPARSALITKSCLLAKSQSQSFFSSSLTLKFFIFFFGKYNTVLLSIFLYPCLPPASSVCTAIHYFIIHLVCIPPPFPNPLSTALWPPLQTTNILENVGQKIFALSLFACTICSHIIWPICASLVAHKIQS